MQVPDLIEQRLKLFVGNRHDRPGGRRLLDKSFPTSPLSFCRRTSRSSERAPGLGQPRKQRRRGRVLVAPASSPRSSIRR
jgi:hypothetical protein